MEKASKWLLIMSIVYLYVLNISCSIFEKGELIEPSQIIEIPIVFHVIHDGTAVGVGKNISANRFNQQVENLNKHYAPANIKFRLASLNIEGEVMAEKGINRIQTILQPRSESIDYVSDPQLREMIWDPNFYLNVFLVSPLNISGGGAAPFPNRPIFHGIKGLTSGKSDNQKDYKENVAVVIDYRVIRGDYDYLYTEQHTLPHEVGHLFGLFHVFDNTDCLNDDFCEDTYHYSTANPINSQGVARFTCNQFLIPNPNNIMDYIYPAAKSSMNFTNDQNDRMRECLSYCFIIRNLNKSEK